MTRGGDPLLLTPGPLTTSGATKQAMLRDWGSWDGAFNRMTESVCRDLLAIAGAGDGYACVPLQGSGTFAVEAAIGTLVPRSGRLLVPNNGAYCARILRICRYLERSAVELPVAEDRPVTGELVAAALDADASLTHVALVHCETGTGMLNDLAGVARACRERGKALIVDAMSSFAALPIDLRATPVDALVAASGKCLEGVPGMGFVIAPAALLERCAGNSHSLALDLHDQYAYLRRTGQWRFTPPTHVVAALRAAIDQFQTEGGQPARLARYRANCRVLVDGLRALGLRTFLADEQQAPIIVTWHAPADPAYEFGRFYAAVRERGFILYPGKLTQIETFRVGCIGAIGTDEMRSVVEAVRQALVDIGVRTGPRECSRQRG